MKKLFLITVLIVLTSISIAYTKCQDEAEFDKIGMVSVNDNYLKFNYINESQTGSLLNHTISIRNQEMASLFKLALASKLKICVIESGSSFAKKVTDLYIWGFVAN
ncbi:hypothetical protein [Francisella philomiragia]|uniref:hypothetical protein n=1 Tax=Francisella philomiragia TaxID=28110 RepID=UPI003518B642